MNDEDKLKESPIKLSVREKHPPLVQTDVTAFSEASDEMESGGPTKTEGQQQQQQQQQHHHQQSPTEEPANLGANNPLDSDSHSLLHGLRKSGCDTKWDMMAGSDSLRKCRICNANVYQVQGLSEQKTRDLVAGAEPTVDLSRHQLYRRDDGTMMTVPGYCSKMALLLSYLPLVFFAAAYLLPDFVRMYRVFQFPTQSLLSTFGFAALAILTFFQVKRSGKQTWGNTGIYLICASSICIWMSTPFMSSLHNYQMAIIPATIVPLLFLGVLVCFVNAGVEGARRKLTGKGEKRSESEPRAQVDSAPEVHSKSKKTTRNVIIAAITVILGAGAYLVWDSMWYFDMMSQSVQKSTSATPGSMHDAASLEKLLARSSGDRADYVRYMLGLEYSLEKKTPKAKELFQANIQNLAGKNVNNQILVRSRDGLATCWEEEKNYKEAEAECSRALKDLLRPNASQGGVRIVLGAYQSLSLFKEFEFEAKRQILSLLASIKIAEGELPAAEAHYAHALKKFDGEKFDYISIYFNAVRPYTAFLKQHGRTEDATKVVENYEKDCQKFLEPNRLGAAENCVSEAYADLNDPRAETALAKAVLAESRSDHSYSLTDARIKYAKFLAKNGKDAKAQKLFGEAIEATKALQLELNSNRAILGRQQNYQLQTACEAYGDFLSNNKKFAEAESNYRATLKDMAIKDESMIPIDYDNLWTVKVKLADCLLAQHKTPAALDLMREVESSLKHEELSPQRQFYFMKHYSEVLKAAGAADHNRFAKKMAELKRQTPDVDEPFSDID